ncbi:MAG: Ig-like domain-containing protein [Stackebrandtia sp.]
MKSRLSRRAVAATATGVFVITFAAACGQDATLVSEGAAEESAASVTVTPEADTKDVPTSAEIGVEVKDGELSEVKLVNSDGDAVEGKLHQDGTSWVPGTQLEYDTEYTATVTAVDSNDIPATVETTFTTMSSPGSLLDAYLWNSSDYEYGQAMPIMLDFPREFTVPEDNRAEVESRLFVESDPPQPGVWHWFSGNHLEYRPENYWEPGTEITIRLALGGHPLGDDWYGSQDVTGKMTIEGKGKTIDVSNEDKSMKAMEAGEEVKSMPISLGKDSTPSYSGTMIVMEKDEETVFDTTNEPGCDGKEDGKDCYKVDIEYAMRLTWSGQYIHAAPWSVGDQGTRNVSHGCVNSSTDDAKWVFDWAPIGTPVVVDGTGVDLPYGDGFSAYDLSWDEFKEGSYLDDGGDTEEE